MHQPALATYAFPPPKEYTLPVLVTTRVDALPHVMSVIVPKLHLTGAKELGLPNRPAYALAPVLHRTLSAGVAQCMEP